MTESVQLGPFELAEPIGDGGMGAVYRAEHADTGQPVAIKVLLAESAREAKHRRDFRREVQALARLHHTAIAAILDYGEIDPATARRGPETFVPETPWFAMEYVEGRSLKSGAQAWEWSRFDAFLQTTLDALAHAHARSIIHRDLKPSNVLVGEPTGAGAPDITLVDFGIARLFDRDDSAEEESSTRRVGTPKYMAPEQIRGDWRDQGAPTDLYALGCIAWRLVCGRAPFAGDTTGETLKGHLQGELPEYAPRFAVPDGLEAWLRELLHRDPDRRPQCAADAAWQLLQLGDPVAGAGDEVGRDRSETVRAPAVRPTLRGLADTLVEEGDATELLAADPLESDPGESPEPGDGRGGEADGWTRPSGVPPVMPHWEREGSKRTAAVLPRAGLELFALREVPVVDRRPERDRLWETLRSVADHGDPELVVLEAGVGAGKTRLAQWFCRRVRETGAANVVEARHEPTSAPDAGLRGLVRRHFRTQGLSRAEVHDRLLEKLPSLGDDMRPVDARALTELLRPMGEADDIAGPRYQFSSPDQKYGLVRRLLARIASERPVVMWVDDLQWGRETIAALEDVLDERTDAPPVLVVATVRSDLVADDVSVGDRLESLYETVEPTRIELSAMAPSDHRTLMDRLLDLDPALADTLAERTEGNPLFLTQLLRYLVEEDYLEAGSDGFQLADGLRIDVPEDVGQVWLERIGRLVANYSTGDPDATGRAVEMAAALGPEVDDREWRAICDRCGFDRPAEFRDALVERGLADRTDEGWAFAHGLMVETLEERAREGGRARDHHRRCAELLEEVYPDRPRQTAARRAEHWIEAEAFERALDPLLEEARRVRRIGDKQRRTQMLERRETVLERAGIPADDPRAIENALLLEWVELQRGSDPESARDRFRELRRRAERIDSGRLVSKAWRGLSKCRQHLGQGEAAREAAAEAVRAAKSDDNTGDIIHALVERGWADYWAGNPSDAERHFREALSRSDDRISAYQMLEAQRGLAWAAVSRGDDERATSLFEELFAETRRAGYRGLQGSAVNGLAELARFRGDFDESRRHYQRHRQLALELNQTGVAKVVEMNIGLLDLKQRRFESALDHLRTAERQYGKLERRAEYAHILDAGRLALAAGTGDWSTFDEVFDVYEDGWPEDATLIKDHPWTLEMAGDFAADAGESGRAARVWELTRDLWRRLEDEEAASRVDAKLSEL